MPETPRLRHGNRNPQNLYLVNADGSETFAGVAMTPEYADMIVQRFNATTEADTRADVDAERTRIARHFADMTVTREWRRRFEDRHAEHLANGVTVHALLSAVADEIKGLARDPR